MVAEVSDELYAVAEKNPLKAERGPNPANHPAGDDSLWSEALDTEEPAERANGAAAEPVARPRRRALLYLYGLGALVAIEAVAIGLLLARPRAALGTTLTIEAGDAGGEVWVDGKQAGVTPLRLDLSGHARSLRFVPAAVPGARKAETGEGKIEVTSQPPGARVTIDGDNQGVTPIVVTTGAGPHAVAVANGASITTGTVQVVSGATASFAAALPAAGVQAGWVTVEVPVELQVREGGGLIGTTAAERLMLAAGRHDLELSSSALGFRTTLSVEVQAGKTSTAKVAIPSGSLSVNAVPWANVFVDGQSVGATPVANLSIPIGSHEIIWRHPELGERRQTAVVTTRGPVRVIVDLTK